MEGFVGILPAHIYAEHASISENPLPIMKDPYPLRVLGIKVLTMALLLSLFVIVD